MNSNTANIGHDNNGHHVSRVTITIDGVSFTTEKGHEQCSALLWMAGVDPAQYDLAIVKQHGQTQVFGDDTVINLKNGDAFVTVRQSAQVA
ncbi:MAG: hypothetical protein IPO89_15025 [Actinomycetales bacterium]|nr:hypothetical protein [Candidatus Lutibacillus vidarii]